MQRKFITKSVDQTTQLGRSLGARLQGGEVIELVSDLGGGKTTLVGGIVAGFGSSDPVASPSFTLSYTYGRPDGKQFHHFDFYRLDDAGIVGAELEEFLGDSKAVVAVEWGAIVHATLPADRLTITISVKGEDERLILAEFPEKLNYLFKGIVL